MNIKFTIDGKTYEHKNIKRANLELTANDDELYIINAFSKDINAHNDYDNVQVRIKDPKEDMDLAFANKLGVSC